MEAAKDIGRPPKPPKEVRRNKLEIRLSDLELDELRRVKAVNLSTWAREVLLRAAKRRG
jgi:hypothetical protein